MPVVLETEILMVASLEVLPQFTEYRSGYGNNRKDQGSRPPITKWQ